jgi:hypothetical protein
MNVRGSGDIDTLILQALQQCTVGQTVEHLADEPTTAAVSTRIVRIANVLSLGT